MLMGGSVDEGREAGLEICLSIQPIFIQCYCMHWQADVKRRSWSQNRSGCVRPCGAVSGILFHRATLILDSERACMTHLKGVNSESGGLVVSSAPTPESAGGMLHR